MKYKYFYTFHLFHFSKIDMQYMELPVHALYPNTIPTFLRSGEINVIYHRINSRFVFQTSPSLSCLNS